MYLRRLFNAFWTSAWPSVRCKLVILLALIYLGFVLAPSSSMAQSASFRSVDTNSDGVLSFNELVAAFGLDGANRIMRSTDHNGDSRITILELRRSPDDDDRDDGDDGEDDGDDDGGDDRGDDD